MVDSSYIGNRIAANPTTSPLPNAANPKNITGTEVGDQVGLDVNIIQSVPLDAEISVPATGLEVSVIAAVDETIGLANRSYISGSVAVLTSPVEAKVGGSALTDRLGLRINNKGPDETVYFGPSGVDTSTGEPLYPGQSVELDFGDDNPVFLVASATGSTCIVQEFS